MPKYIKNQTGPGNIFPVLLFFGLLLLARQTAASERYWVFFVDKGPETQTEYRLDQAQARMEPRTLYRRSKMRSAAAVVDPTDLPVYDAHIQALIAHGFNIHTISKWLNAVSIAAAPEQLALLEKLPFVEKVQQVLCFKKAPFQLQPALNKTDRGWSGPAGMDYGSSLAQNQLMKVPAVHEMGYSGQGVLIAVFDTGFRLNHEALAHLKVRAQYDFINNDPVTDLEPGDPSVQISHGTHVLSILAGYQPGHLIGPAYSAEFLLAKTEDTSREYPAEEDNWIAAAEWAEALGVDIISSSLGYNDWYSYEDMNGNTAPITRAADLAVKKGVLVVVAAGNEGDLGWKYILAPADGDSVIAVGAIQSDGVIANFSSRGPTRDGRIKPDLVAMGVSVTCVNVPATTDFVSNQYSSVSGTSASCPLAAGAAALVLSAHPELTPMQVRSSLIATADRAEQPDNIYGHGLINTLAALSYWGPMQPAPQTFRLLSAYPNPFDSGTHSALHISADLDREAFVRIRIMDLLGRQIVDLFRGLRSAGKNRTWNWNGRDANGTRVASGIYFIHFQAGSFSQMEKFTILN